MTSLPGNAPRFVKTPQERLAAVFPTGSGSTDEIVVEVDGIVAWTGAIGDAGSGSHAVELGWFAANLVHTVTVAEAETLPSLTGQTTGATVTAAAVPAAGSALAVATPLPAFPATDLLIDDISIGLVPGVGAQGLTTFIVPSTAPAALPSPPPIVLGSGPDTVALFLSETAWQGDAQYEVLVNGVPQGGILTADVLQGSGQEREVDVKGNFATVGQEVSVLLLNAASGGTPATSRTLSLDAVTYDGVDLDVSAALTSDSEASVFVGSPRTLTLGSGPDAIEIQASERGFAAGAKLAVAVDGVQIVQPITVQADGAGGASQTIILNGLYTAGQHSVSLWLANPADAAAAASLTLASVTIDGVTQPSLTGTLSTSNPLTTSAAFTGPAAAATPTGPAGASDNVGLVPVSAPAIAAGTRVLTVGTGEEYQTIAAAVTASQDGDVILVDAGTYTNDFVTNYHKITLEAVGGRVEMVATVPPPNLKGLITEEADLTVIGFDFSGVAIDDASGGNGAGIRVDGGNLVLENDYFTGNQNGLLVNSGTDTITIDHSVFDDNGSGSGYTHNVYIGAVAAVTVTNSVFENAQVGHEFKSRAAVNTISNSTFIDGVGIGDGSYDVDLPDGGQDTLTNDTFVKGPNSPNYALVHFGGEGLPYAGSELQLTDDVFQAVNNPNALPVLNQTSLPVQLTGNTFIAIQGGLVNGPANVTNSVDGNGDALPDQTTTAALPTGAIVFNDAAPHTVTLGTDASAVQGGAGYLTVDDTQGHVLIVGGTGGVDVEEGPLSGGSTVETAVGSTNLLNLVGLGIDTVYSEGTDTIMAGFANQSGVIDGTATIEGGSGNTTWSVNGTATFLTASGSTFLSLGSNGVLSILGTGGFYEVNSNGGSVSWDTTDPGNTLSGHATGGFSLQNYSGQAHVTTAGGTTTVMSFDTGDVSLTSVGPDVLYAGSGNDTFVVSDGATVYAGTGTLGVFARGGGGGANVFGAAGDTTIDGDSGGITYHGGDQANSVEARLSGITLLGGAGHMTVNNYAGNEVIVGGLGGLTVNLLAVGGGTVTTAAHSASRLTLTNATVHSFGNDSIGISGGGGNYDVHGDSTVTIDGGTYYGDISGNDVVTTLSGFQHVTAEAGANLTLNASTAATTFVQVAAGASLQASLIGSTVASGALASVIASGGANLTASAGSGGLSLQTDGAGSETVTMNGAVSLGSAGADAIHAGAGPQQVTLTGSGAQIWGGSGTLAIQDNDWSSPNVLTINGGSGALTLSESGATTMQFIGGSGAANLSGGNMTILAGSGAVTASGHIVGFTGGSGAATLSLDTNGAQVTFGTGATQVTESVYGAADVYTFVQAASGGGTELISNFKAGTDRMVLGSGVAVVNQGVTSAGAVFTLSNGAHLTLAGLTSTAGVFH